MKTRILCTGLVAIVMGTAAPAQPVPYQDMYYYYHYDDYGNLVGQQSDLCTNSGVVTQGRWISGYGTANVETVLWAGCHGGQLAPIRPPEEA